MSEKDIEIREERLLAMSGGDKSLAVELARLFMFHYPDMHKSLRESVHMLDPLKVRESVHMIEGSLGAMGSEESLEKLASLGQAGRDLKTDLFKEIFDSYDKAIDKSNVELKTIVARWL